MSRRLPLAGLLLVGLSACKDPPSFRARWSLLDRDGESQPATAAQQCSTLGINTVRIRVFDENGDIADDSFHACFARGFADPDATVNGPALDAGRYAVEVRGVQRDLEPWAPVLPGEEMLKTCSLDDVACDSRDIACDCREFEARDDHTGRIDDFVITAPDECIDGIDNDRDGLLDANDPSCGLGVTPGREGNPVSKVQFRVLLSLFDANPLVSCLALGLTDLRARVCPREPDADAAPCDGEDTIEIAVACRDGEPTYFERTLTEGTYSIDLAGRGVGGVVLTTPQAFPLTVAPGAGAFVPIAVDFPSSAFDPPIEAHVGFALKFGDASGSEACGDGHEALGIETVELEVLDAHGAPLPGPPLAADGDTNFDGTPSPCPPAPVSTLTTLTWGGYSLRATGRRADGTACFSTDGTGPGGVDAPLRLAPNSTAIIVVVPRILDADGNPPPGC